MSQEMKKYYEEIQKNFIIPKKEFKEEVLGRMTMEKNEKVIESEFIEPHLLYTITPRQLMIMESKMRSKDFSFQSFNFEDLHLTVIDAIKDEKNVQVLCKSKKETKYFLKEFFVQDAIEELETVELDLEFEPLKMHIFSGNLFILDESGTNLVMLPWKGKGGKMTLILAIDPSKSLFIDKYLLSVDKFNLAVFNLETKRNESIAFDQKMDVIKLLPVMNNKSSVTVMMASKDLEIALYSFGTRKFTFLNGLKGMSIQGPGSIICSGRESISFINEEDSCLYWFKFTRTNSDPKMVKKTNRTTNLLSADRSSNLLVSIDTSDMSIHLESLNRSIDLNKTKDVDIDAGTSQNSTAFLEHHGLMISSGGSAKLHCSSVKTGKAEQSAGTDGEVIFISPLEHASQIIVITKKTVSLYSVEPTLKQVSLIMKSSNGMDIEVIRSPFDRRFGIYCNDQICIYENGVEVFRRQHVTYEIYFCIHEKTLKGAAWDGKKMIVAFLNRVEKFVLPLDSQPGGMIMFDKIVVAIYNDKIVFLKETSITEDTRYTIENIFSVIRKNAVQEVNIITKVAPASRNLVVVIFKEIFVLNIDTLTLEKYFSLDMPTNIIKNIFISTQNQFEWKVLWQNFITNQGTMLTYEKTLESIFTWRPRGFESSMFTQSKSQKIDAIYRKSINRIKVFERNSWNFRNEISLEEEVYDFKFWDYPDEHVLLALLANGRIKVLRPLAKNAIKGEIYSKELEEKGEVSFQKLCPSNFENIIYFSSSTKVIKTQVIFQEKHQGKNLEQLKEVELPLIANDFIQQFLICENKSTEYLIVCTHLGGYFSLTTNLEITRLYQAQVEENIGDFHYTVSPTGRFAVQSFLNSLKVIDLLHGEKVVYSEMEVNKSNIFTSLGGGVKRQRIVTFDANDKIMVVLSEGKLKMISLNKIEKKILNASSTKEFIIQKELPPYFVPKHIQLIGPGCTLLMVSKTSIKRWIFSTDQIQTSMNFPEVKIFYTPALANEPFSWFGHQNGLLNCYDRIRNCETFTVQMSPIGSYFALCATPDNSRLAYLGHFGQGGVFDVPSGAILYQRPLSSGESFTCYANDFEQNLLFYQNSLGQIFCLNLTTANEEVVYQKYDICVSMAYGLNNSLYVLTKDEKEIRRIDLVGKGSQTLRAVGKKTETVVGHQLLAYMKSSNSLLAVSSSSVIFFDCDRMVYQKRYKNMSERGIVINHISVSDDERFFTVTMKSPKKHIELVRLSNLKVLKEIPIEKKEEFISCSVSNNSKFINIFCHGVVKIFSLDTFNSEYTNLMVKNKYYQALTPQSCLDYNYYRDCTALSALCLSSDSSEESHSLEIIKRFKKLFTYNINQKMISENKCMLYDFVDGPNFGEKDMIIWNYFLMMNNCNDIQEELNILIYEAPITNPYASDPMGKFLELTNETELVELFGEEFFAVYFANFVIEIEDQGRKSILVDSKILKKGVNKQSLPCIESKKEKKAIVGDITNTKVIRSMAKITRTRLDIFDKELLNPRFTSFLFLLNALPIKIFLNEPIAILTDFYWSKFQAVGLCYFWFFILFMCAVWYHSCHAMEYGLQFEDYAMATIIVFSSMVFLYWELMNVLFQGIKYFLRSANGWITIFQNFFLFLYLYELFCNKQVGEEICAVVQFLGMLKVFLLIQYIDGVRQFSTRILKVLYDVQLFFLLLVLTILVFCVIMMEIPSGKDEPFFIKFMNIFGYFFCNWSMHYSNQILLFFQLILVIGLAVIAFNILIALVEQSWDESGELGMAFDRKKKMGLVISNLSILGWFSSKFSPKRNLSIEQVFMFLYEKTSLNVNQQEKELLMEELLNSVERIEKKNERISDKLYQYKGKVKMPLGD